MGWSSFTSKCYYRVRNRGGLELFLHMHFLVIVMIQVKPLRQVKSLRLSHTERLFWTGLLNVCVIVNFQLLFVDFFFEKGILFVDYSFIF